MSYASEYQRSLNEPEAFWKDQAENIAWFKKPEAILEALDDGTHRWFADGELNSSYLALDYQIEQGRGEQTALI
ncbi:acetyl-coenzyme A synthetase N-terminal domain-containing protein, partial [Oceanospirillum sp. HFRX-1_2]